MKELSPDEIRSFQQERGLHVTGQLNDSTLRALEEARWKLGDRSLNLQPSPMMHGDDVAALVGAGFEAFGWDPHYAQNGGRASADVVNLGFVLNVIEDIYPLSPPEPRPATVDANAVFNVPTAIPLVAVARIPIVVLVRAPVLT
jgi:hypothetical protein